MSNKVTIEKIKVGDKSLKQNELYGFFSIHPLPSQKELFEFYSQKYYEAKPNFLEKQRVDNKHRQSVFKTVLSTVEEHRGTNPGKILDIGCGVGFFLEFMKNQDWSATGIELSKAASSTALKNGLNVYSNEFDHKFIDEAGKFDLIYMNEVLEHVHNPETIIKTCFDALEDNGLLYISVPNDFNPFQMILLEQKKYKPWWVSPPEHIHYFSFESLSNLLSFNKFKIVDLSTSFPIDIFLLMGQNYVEDPILGKKCHNLRTEFESTMIESGNNKLLKQIYNSFAKLHLGRHVKILAQKIN